jgi:hypothetical protein
MNADDAFFAARGWLNMDAAPLGSRFDATCSDVAAYNDGKFYCVSLEPEGYILLNADDRLEPVAAFSSKGAYDDSTPNPLRAMIYADSNAGIEYAGSLLQTMNTELTATQTKWVQLKAASDGYISTMGYSSLSDVRVAPFVQTLWGQGVVCGKKTYNLYTPNSYPAGCVATAMSQLMKYYEQPSLGIGVIANEITVSDASQTAYTRGGDGSGGAYDWASMTLDPDCTTPTASREAIGALCADAGVAVGMSYESNSASAYNKDAALAFIEVFDYSQAGYINGYPGNIHDKLGGVIDANLNAEAPVILGIVELSTNYAHAVICDGYGYQSGTLYHHINMGWDGEDNVWYNLPEIDASDTYDSIYEAVYNVFPDKTGAIISGRVVTAAGAPIEGALLTAGTLSAITDSNGIYAITGIAKGTYNVKAQVNGQSDQSKIATVKSVYDNYYKTTEWTNTSDTNFTFAAAPPSTYTVSFSAGLHGEITSGNAVQEVEPGTAATAPAIAAGVGYEFIGWDTDFSNVTSDLTVTALYRLLSFTVEFSAGVRGEIIGGLAIQTVTYGGSATAPTIASEADYEFTGWDTDFSNVTSDLFVSALYNYTSSGSVFSYDIKPGYNWISFPVLPVERSISTVLAQYEQIASDLDLLVNSAGQIAQYYDGSWYGPLDTIGWGKKYVFVSEAGGSFDVVGEAVAEETPIAIAYGWNWIGSPLQSQIAVSEAFANSTLTNMDKLVNSQGQLAQYYGGSWYGTLTSLEPGVGYSFWCAEPQTLYFTQP